MIAETSSPATSKKPKGWLGLLARSVELRVILAIPALLGLMQPWLPRDLIWFARVPGAMILRWNDLMVVIGRWIGALPLLPDLSVLVVNYIMTLGLLLSVGFQEKTDNHGKIKIQIMVGLLCFVVAIALCVFIDWLISTSVASFLAVVLIAVFGVFSIALAIKYNPRLRRVLFIVAGSIALLQALYWLNVLPWADAVDAVLQAELGPPE